MTDIQDDKVLRLASAILATINDFADDEHVTIADGCNALFTALVLAAKNAPNYSPQELIRQTDAAIRYAVGLQ